MERKHVPNNPKQRHQSNREWKFTFCGGISEKPSRRRNRVKFNSELARSELRSAPVFPLSNTEVGDLVTIAQIMNCKSMIYGLDRMGLIKGSEVRVISKTQSGSVIICFQDEQIGLGAGMANKVMVTCTSEKS